MTDSGIIDDASRKSTVALIALSQTSAESLTSYCQSSEVSLTLLGRDSAALLTSLSQYFDRYQTDQIPNLSDNRYRT